MPGDSWAAGSGVAELLQRIGDADRRDRIAVVDDRAAITFGALAERCSRFSAGLLRSGIAPGDRVMLCLLDTIDWPMAFLGSLQAGATPVCADTRLDAAQYEALLRDSEARLLIVSRSLYPPFDGLLQRVESLARVEISEAPLADGGDITVLLAIDEEAEPPPRPPLAEVCRLSDGARSVAWLDTFATRTTTRMSLSGAVTLEIGDRCLGSGRLCEPPMLEHLLLPALSIGATTILVAEEWGPRALRPRLAGERPDALEGHAPNVLFTTAACLRELTESDALQGVGGPLRTAVVVDQPFDQTVADLFSVRTGARVVAVEPIAAPPVEEAWPQGAEAPPPDLHRRDGPEVGDGPDDGPEPGTSETEPPRAAPRVVMFDALSAAPGVPRPEERPR